jgi:hypothetical protein
VVRLVTGRHTLEDADTLLEQYRQQVRRGPTYYGCRSNTDPERVTVEDLGLAVLLEGRPSSRAAQTLVEAPVDLSGVVPDPLHETTAADRAAVVDAVMELVGSSGSGFASSLATKVLHKKRPATIPVLDNSAIYATLCSDTWERGQVPRGQSVRARSRIADALERVHGVVSDPANRASWETLERAWPSYTRIELFDMAWWAYVRCLDVPDSGS